MIIIILFIVFILILLSIFVFHKYLHRFWITQPVPWGTLIPSKGGIIQKNIKRTPHSEISSHYTDAELAAFIQNNYLDLKEPFHNNWSESYIRNLSNNEDTQFLILRDNNKNIIGCVQGTQIQLWLEGNLYKVIYVDKLIVKKSFRKKKLAPKLIENIIHHFDDTSIGIFRCHERLPWPHVMYDELVWTEIKISLQPDKQTSFIWEKLNNQDKLVDTEEKSQTLDIKFADNMSFLEYIKKSSNDTIFYSEKGWVFLQRLPIHFKGKTVYSINAFTFLTDWLEFFCNTVQEDFILICSKATAEHFQNEKWEIFEICYWYLYNYRINKRIVKPDNFFIPVV
jgi:hypothetical protein